MKATVLLAVWVGFDLCLLLVKHGVIQVLAR